MGLNTILGRFDGHRYYFMFVEMSSDGVLFNGISMYSPRFIQYEPLAWRVFYTLSLLSCDEQNLGPSSND